MPASAACAEFGASAAFLAPTPTLTPNANVYTPKQVLDAALPSSASPGAATAAASSARQRGGGVSSPRMDDTTGEHGAWRGGDAGGVRPGQCTSAGVLIDPVEQKTSKLKNNKRFVFTIYLPHSALTGSVVLLRTVCVVTPISRCDRLVAGERHRRGCVLSAFKANSVCRRAPPENSGGKVHTPRLIIFCSLRVHFVLFDQGKAEQTWCISSSRGERPRAH